MSRTIAGQPYDVRVDCEGCGFYLGYLVTAPDGGLLNVDPRPQPKAGHRLVHDIDHGRWTALCKCGATPAVRDERLRAAVTAVTAAGLGHMPFRGISA